MVLPVAASSAITSLGLWMVYMTPSTTSGVTLMLVERSRLEDPLERQILRIGRRDLRERAMALAVRCRPNTSASSAAPVSRIRSKGTLFTGASRFTGPPRP